MSLLEQRTCWWRWWNFGCSVRSLISSSRVWNTQSWWLFSSFCRSFHVHFDHLYIPNDILISSMNVLTILMRLWSWLSLDEKSLRCEMDLWLILYPILVCETNQESGKRHKMKKSTAGLSPWKIPVLISNSGVDISPFVCVRCNDVFQFFIVDSMKFIIVASNLCIFKMSIIQSWGTESPFCNRSTLLKSFLFLASSWMILLMRSWSMVPNVLAEFSVFFCSGEILFVSMLWVIWEVITLVWIF